MPGLKSGDLQENFDQEFKPLLDEYRHLGIVVGVIERGQHRYFSLGKNAQSKPVDKESVFLINSMTKVFTGSLLGVLSAESKLDLDLPIKEQSKRGEKFELGAISFLDLATHTSGLPRLPSNLVSKNKNDLYRDYTDELFRDYFSATRNETRELASRKYLYSNLGFGLLGFLMARQGGKSFSSLLKQKIFSPLKLKNTFVSEGQDSRALAGFLKNGEQVLPRSGPESMQGSWAVYSSAQDLLRFLSEAISPTQSSHGRGIDIAQKEYRDYGVGFSAGLGWSIVKDTETRFKNGSSGGYHSIMMFNRKTQTALVLLSNTDFKNNSLLENKAWRLFRALN